MWCQKLLFASCGMPNLQVCNGLWYLDDRLIVPAGCGVRQEIFCMAYDTLGHFGFRKTYNLIHSSYFWPNMQKDLKEGYIPSCPDCQWNKGSTQKPTGPLHPLPVPDDRCQSVAINFISPLPEDNGFNCILTITDQLNLEYHFIPTHMDISAKQLALLFFDRWYCENGLPSELLSDRDKLFMSRFWPRGTYRLNKIPGSVNFFKPGHPPSPPVGITYHKRLFPRKIYHKKENILPIF